MRNSIIFIKARFLLMLLLWVVGIANAQNSILFDVTSISHYDERIFFTFNVLNDGRFHVINGEKDGIFVISPSESFEDIDITEAFADFQKQKAIDFLAMDKTKAAETSQQYKNMLPDIIVSSLMMDYYIESRQNNHCVNSEQYCSNDQYIFPAGVNSGNGESGPNYSCLSTTPNPAWYYLRIGNPGDINIHIYSTPSHDIDFCCWGPFDDPISPCPYGLTANKVVSCSYSTNYDEHCSIPSSAQTGEYYIMVITNYSNQNCNIIFSQEGGSGTAECLLQINAYAFPDEGGVVSGSGSYEIGETCSLVAQANPGFTFYNWTENGEQVSTSSNYEFIVNRDRDLIANFTTGPYVVTASVEPVNSGTISGMGGFEYGQNCTLQAEANTGYTFEKWTENDNTVSTDATYTFNVTESRNLVAHFKVSTYNITASADPPTNGEAIGSGTYEHGQNCTVRAISNNGYEFVNWTENGVQVSTFANYTFPVNRNRTLVAHFQERSYTISVSANPSIGGTVSGSGSFNNGQTCTVSATPASGYIFINWTENGSEVSMDANYSFVVTGNRSLVAWFRAPNGSLNGIFSVRSNSKVYFSQGNLQYNPGTGIWQFAENQYEYIGIDNSNISQTYVGWIDLFGWGTSGHYHGYECYQPWATSPDYNDYYASSDLQGTTDWGYNRIVNGGDQYNVWRTMSSEEWNYVLHHRYTPSGIRFAKGRVNSVNGVIIVPDLWSDSFYVLHGANDETASYNSNVISGSDWSMMQNHGAVFLPAAGYRKKTSIQQVDVAGDYWTRSNKDEVFAYCLEFDEDRGQIGSLGRYYGCSVRLVKDVQPTSVESNETNAMIYPNPTKDIVYIKGEKFERIEVVNTMGQLLMSQEQVSSCAELNLNHLSPGIYFLKVYYSKGIVCYRLIKE